MRAPGQTWFRLPLFVWTLYATSVVQLLGTPVLAMLLILTAIERVAGIGIFDWRLGGDPLLFQHLFWFYSHPAVYIMILPGMGVTSEIISAFSRKHIFGYHFVALASMAIALFGFLVWGHHMFVSGQSVYASMVFSIISFLVAVPSAVKVFNWTATLYRGSIVYDTPMVFAVGFIALFTVGGLTGLFLACLGTDIHLHDTYFIVAHFHFIMVGGMLLAYMAGAALLVAESDRTHVLGRVGADVGDPDFRGIHPHIFPAVPVGLPRHAATISRISARVPGAQHPVVGRGHRVGGRLRAAAVLSCGLAVHRTRSRAEPMGSDRPGMDNRLAAPDRELPRNAYRDHRTVQLRVKYRGDVRPRREDRPDA